MFLKAHWGVISGADFFTTDAWTWRGLLTYYTVFVIDLASRRVQLLGSTPHPDALFMQQFVRTLTPSETGELDELCVLICDRDRKWGGDVQRRLREAGVRVAMTPERAPNANAYAERFVRSIKEECLDRLIPIGSATSAALSPNSSSLSSGAKSPGTRQSVDCWHAGGQDDEPRATPSTTRRFTQLLWAGGVIGSADSWNNTRAVQAFGRTSTSGQSASDASAAACPASRSWRSLATPHGILGTPVPPAVGDRHR